MTPIDLRKGVVATSIRIAGVPQDIGIAPGGAAAYVISSAPGAADGTITPIDLASRKTGPLIDAGLSPLELFLGGDGTTAYIKGSKKATSSGDYGPDMITPITLATGLRHTPITFTSPNGLLYDFEIAPGGATAYAALEDATIIPIRLATGGRGKSIKLGGGTIIRVVIGGTHAYTVRASHSSHSYATTLTTTNLVTGIIGRPVPIGGLNVDVPAISADGSTAYVYSPDNPGTPALTSLTLANGILGRPIRLPYPIDHLVVAPDGGAAYALVAPDGGHPFGAVLPIDLKQGTAGALIQLRS